MHWARLDCERRINLNFSSSTQDFLSFQRHRNVNNTRQRVPPVQPDYSKINDFARNSNDSNKRRLYFRSRLKRHSSQYKLALSKEVIDSTTHITFDPLIQHEESGQRLLKTLNGKKTEVQTTR